MHRLPTHHSTMHLPRTYHPYIFPTTPHTQHPSTHTTIHNHQPWHHSPSHNHPHILNHMYNDYILHKTQHPSLQLTQSSTATQLPAKLTPLHKSHSQAQSIQSNTPQHTTLPTNINATNPHTNTTPNTLTRTHAHSPHQPPYTTFNFTTPHLATLYQAHHHRPPL